MVERTIVAPSRSRIPVRAVPQAETLSIARCKLLDKGKVCFV